MISFSMMLAGCTKLNETLNGNLNSSQVSSGGGSGNVAALLKGVYDNIRGVFQGQDGIYALWEMTTDELVGPTRGPDWDDNGAWRVLHAHAFTADIARIRSLKTFLIRS